MSTSGSASQPRRSRCRRSHQRRARSRGHAARIRTFGPRQGEPDHDDRRVARPADEPVGVEEAPQRSSRFHAPSLRLRFALKIGRASETVHPLSGVPRIGSPTVSDVVAAPRGARRSRRSSRRGSIRSGSSTTTICGAQRLKVFARWILVWPHLIWLALYSIVAVRDGDRQLGRDADQGPAAGADPPLAHPLPALLDLRLLVPLSCSPTRIRPSTASRGAIRSTSRSSRRSRSAGS